MEIQLTALRKTLDEQKVQMKSIKDQLEALGIKQEQISLDVLSQEDRDEYLAFERELKDITNLVKKVDLSQSVKRPKKRQMV
ncbi:MAG: hypothetical protein R3Y11_03290 [Pseudomonadota bacterium]